MPDGDTVIDLNRRRSNGASGAGEDAKPTAEDHGGHMLYLFLGPPGSGKELFAERIAHAGIPTFSSDREIRDLRGEQRNAAAKFEAVRRMARNTVGMLRNGHDVASRVACFRWGDRALWLGNAEAHGARATLLRMDTSLEDCRSVLLRRNCETRGLDQHWYDIDDLSDAVLREEGFAVRHVPAALAFKGLVPGNIGLLEWLRGER